MSILDIGAGSGKGLEDLLARLREDEMLRQRQQTIDEGVRRDRADESFRDKELQLRRDELGVTNAARAAAAKSLDQQRAFNEAKTAREERGIGDVVSPEEVKRETDAGLSPSVYDPAGKQTMSVIPMVGTQTQVDVSPPESLQSVDSIYRGTGKDRAAAERQAAADAKAEAAANKTHTPTGPEMEGRYLDIQSRMQTNPASVTADDKAFSTAYERNKKLGIDESADRAGQRQDKQFKFQQHERFAAAIKPDLAKLADAQQSASVLRDLSDLASTGGNQVAASVVPMAGALAISTSAGVHRINTAEIRQFGGGSILRRLESKADLLSKGQIPNDVAADLKALADIIEKDSKARFEKQFKNNAALYGIENADPSKFIEQEPQASMAPPPNSLPVQAPLDPSIDALLKRGKPQG